LIPPRGLASPRLDRWGARLAWLIIIAGVGLTAWHVVQYTRAMDALTAGRGKNIDAIPAHRINPQLTMQSKAVVATRRVVGSEEKDVTEQLRSAAKTPAEKVWIIPVIAEVDGKDAALAELDRLYPRRTATTQPAATQPAATAPAATTGAVAATLPALRSTPVSRDAEALRTIYEKGPDALSPPDRVRLVGRLGWAGRLALVFGKPDTDPERADLLGQATTYFSAWLGFIAVALGGLIAGIVLLIVTIVRLHKRKLWLRYEPTTTDVAAANSTAPELMPAPMPAPAALPPGVPPPPPWPTPPAPPTMWPGQMNAPPYFIAGMQVPPHYGVPFPPAPPPVQAPPYRLGKLGESNGRTAPFVEAFALYLVAYLGVGELLRLILDASWLGSAQWIAFAAFPIGLAWPWLRGVRGDAWRRGFGWTRGQGVFREMFSGLLAYVTGLPILILGMVASILLMKVSHTTSYHPITTETGAADGGWAAINLLLIAAVAAPVIEETFFRGALFHHLRTRWSWLLSALISSLIFAGVHPQGWVAIPVLGAIALIFCAMREWRSSIIASMTAHALHNGVLVIFLLLGTA
jgi:membrane protease YdiL (CAAX protease family)